MLKESAWKIASKGSRLTFKQIIKVAAGERVFWKSIAPTFSVAKSEPTFIGREIKSTAGDSRHVPRKYDPKYAD